MRGAIAPRRRPPWFLDAVIDHTRMVIVDNISSATARLFPVVDLVHALAHRDIIVVIDGAHSLML